MKIINKVLGFLIIIWIVWVLPEPVVGKVAVFVSIVPQKYFVQQIGKDLVDVQVMVRPGASPHIYEPKPRQMVAISKAKIYFAIGVTFEKIWLRKIASANLGISIVHTDRSIEKIPMVANLNLVKADHNKAEYDSERERHHHGELDPHIWLSPSLVMIQARMILTALQEVDPMNRLVYEANYKAFISELIELDAELANTFSGKLGLQFMVFHPSWGYFADRYGLKQIPVEIEGKDPKPAQLKILIEHAKRHGIKVIFVQPQFSIKSAELIAREIGGQAVFANPLAEDWADNLRKVAQQINTASR